MRIIPDYCRRERSTRRLIWRGFLVAILGSAAVFSVWFLPSRLKFAWVQRACLNYRHPPDQPVYIERDVERLPHPDPRWRAIGPEWASSTDDTCRLAPMKSATLYHQPLPYRQFLDAVSTASWHTEEGVLFLHRRRAPNCEERLVVVGMFPGPSFGVVTLNPDSPRGVDDTLELRLWADVYASGRSAKSASLKRSDYLPLNLGAVKRWQTLLIYGGTPDPADPARCTIRYALDGREGTLEALLQANDTVVIRELREK